ncbi:hypothetical protein [Yoonia sediminilitoris]|uniref:Uncharacterized protein n=1 Tax=Yoonia sediminilitoris TaxID=1286148 RepID=A0A2T6KQG1_9RHOB|nr:hypothetical protein [Yoonia sediminilitoris]PUB18775.1 hypothetical protein C8N45_101362 [Yoonia sediminilitoris]RCW98943.1 hypothetical protein DFP92_101362 [Yoonia sediminilitoris]
MRFAIIILLGLTGCTTFPALEGTISDDARDAPYPVLTARPTAGDSTTTPDTDADLQARIEALERRAEVLRETEIGALQ